MSAQRRVWSSPLPWLGALLIAYLAYPLGAFAYRFLTTGNRGFGADGLWSALGVSIEGATISLVLITVTGVPLAYTLTHHRGRIAAAVGVIVQLPLALPPLMSGILLIYVVGPYTHLGRFFGGRLSESLTGVVIAQSFVSAPFLVIAARSAFATVEPALGELAATLGHRPLARFFRIDLRCAAGAIRAGMVLTWLRAFGEYGATVIVAYHPFSLPIYTDNQFETYPLSTTEAPTLLALAAAALAIGLGHTAPRLRLPRRALPPAQGPSPTPSTPLGFDLDLRVGTFHLSVAHPPGGARLAIVGPSGSGKSLTLRAVAGLLGPHTGTVTYAGTDVTRTATERRRLGYVPQGLGLIPGRTVGQQILFGVHANPARAAWWASTLHIEELLERYPDQLSGGQRQRVALARALACEPHLVLLDEPFSALDAPVRDELRRELRRLQHQTGLSTVLVTHDPHDAALLADDIIVIADGAVLQAGPLTEVYRHPASPAVARLLGIDNVHYATVQPDHTVRTGSITVAAAAPDQLPGSTVLWSVRPEHIALHDPNEAPSTPAWVATVTDVINLGTTTETTVHIHGGPHLRARHHQAHLTTGQPCLVHIHPSDIATWNPAKAERTPHDVRANLPPASAS